MTDRTLIFEKEQWKCLQEICSQGYPREVCGLLFGAPSKARKVTKVDVLENILVGNRQERLQELKKLGIVSLSEERMGRDGTFEFVIDPREHYMKISEAQNSGLDQIGVFHSHPDHPAVPSAVDSSQPFLSYWSNIIVSVQRGIFQEARSWYRENETESFQEEKILVE